MRITFMIFAMMTETKALPIRNKEESNLCAGLYLVPTPIGNLRDITLRALDVLTACDVVVCEDTRVSGKLLSAYHIQGKKKIVYNDHADEGVKQSIVSLIAGGAVVALVSDAGTPLVSDPGYKLVQACFDGGYFITALPGANAVLPALQLSSFSSHAFVFAGFLPSKQQAAMKMLSHYQPYRETVIFYDSPKRIAKTMTMIDQMYGDRQVAVVREISKLFEESLIGTADEILKRIKDKPLKGEIVLVIDGGEENLPSFDLNAMIMTAFERGMSMKDLSHDIAQKTGLKKKDVYERALGLQEE